MTRWLARWRAHRVEYAAEAWALGLFLLSASAFAVLLFHPGSPVPPRIPDPLTRQALMGLAMGLTAALNFYSPWGKRSGAHMNPAVTLAFYRLGKMHPADAVGYVAAQFAGGVAGMLLAAALLPSWIGDPAVNFVATVPGRAGSLPAFAAELGLSALLMTVVRVLSGRPRVEAWTGAVAASLVALFITFETPISGMSLNPARTWGSAVTGQIWTAWWIYFTAPPLGMLLGTRLARLIETSDACAKFRHDARVRCIFCEYQHPVG